MERDAHTPLRPSYTVPVCLGRLVSVVWCELSMSNPVDYCVSLLNGTFRIPYSEMVLHTGCEQSPMNSDNPTQYLIS